MNVRIESSWKEALQAEWDKPYFIRLTEFVREEYGHNTCYPPASKIFAAFDSCPLNKVKVVILGQDPYHGPGQANGLSFSVNPGVMVPRSLCNIFQEISSDLGTPLQSSGDLSRWARQGVFLLNAILTVRAHCAGSHRDAGWETFTDEVIRVISNKCDHVVFMLWGAFAMRKRELIDSSKHLILSSPHPSPLSASRGFFGNKHFSKANEFLISNGMEPIAW